MVRLDTSMREQLSSGDFTPWRRFAAMIYGGLVLTILGATPAEDAVYQYLASVGSADVDELALQCKLPAQEVADALDGLLRRGLAGGIDGRYVAAPPETVEAMLRERMRALWLAQDALGRLASSYRLHHATGNDIMEVVTGRQNLGRRIRQTLMENRDEHLMLVRPPIVALDPSVDDDFTQDPGARRFRAVYDAGLLADPRWLAGIEAGRTEGTEYRAHPQVPVKLIIADRAVAVLPLSHGDDATSAAAFVYTSGLLDALVALFEHVWTASLPIVLDSRNPIAATLLDAAERRLLSLLVAGLTDEAIAAHQGVSPRTVQRRVQALMTATRARTRMQLAWQAAHHGWL
jgi:DNA-binding CsgD family transcriptional regulator